MMSREVDGFLGTAEAVSVRVGEIVLGDLNQRFPVDAFVEVVLKIIVVFEEIRHAYFSPSLFV